MFFQREAPARYRRACCASATVWSGAPAPQPAPWPARPMIPPPHSGPRGARADQGVRPIVKLDLATKQERSVADVTDVLLLAGKTASFILTLALPLLLVRRLSQE